MSDTEANRTLVLTALDVLTGKRPIERAAELFAADYTDHNDLGQVGPERVRAVHDQLFTAFPDLTHEVEECVAERDMITLRVTMTGTHKGPLPGGAPFPVTNRKVRLRSIHMVRVADGQVAEHWAVRDDLDMMRQLGFLPPVAPARPTAAAPA